MATELEVLQAADFDWAMHLRSVWSDAPHDVPEHHAMLRASLSHKLKELRRDSRTESPLGWIVTGPGGTGKTHLLSFVRREALAKNMGFVLVDMTDVHDFWATVLLGYLSSLQQSYDGDRFQHQVLLEHFIRGLNPKEPVEQVLGKLIFANTDQLAKYIKRVLEYLSRRHAVETMRYQDVIRALVALNSSDFTTASIGLTWLNGSELDESDRRALGFTVAKNQPAKIVQALSWLMSLVGPTVLAFDQLDPIVTQMNVIAQIPQTEQVREEVLVARGIIESIAGGLGALRDVTRRTLSVVSCLETTWDILRQQVVLQSALDRYESPRPLPMVNGPEIARALVGRRMQIAYEKTGYRPPYATWPFAPQAFVKIQGMSPRQILRLCYDHQRDCVQAGRISELRDFRLEGPGAAVKPVADPRLDRLDRRLEELRGQFEPASILDEKLEDERLGPLLQAGCHAVVLEHRLPPDVDALVDIDFHGGKTTRALHARVRLVYRSEGDREEHFCLRALQRQHALAFQARLQAAITQSGIDRRLPFRRLIILRTTAFPGGTKTGQLIDSFRQAEGIFYKPTESELRTLWALARMFQENDPQLNDWLRARQPASRLELMRRAVPQLCEGRLVGPAPAPTTPPAVVSKTPPAQQAIPPGATPPGPKAPAASPQPPAATPTSSIPPAASSLPTNVLLGMRLPSGGPLTMPISLLEKHTMVLAGAGSGKTVLLKRLTEEAALSGVPSIVVDGANDLAALGERWPAPPEGWLPDDAAKAERYHAQSEVIVWTPGRESGNPFTIEPIPDLAAVADDAEQLDAAIAMTCESLRPIVAPGRSMAAKNKMGVLSSALRYFAQNGGGRLADFAELLADLPAEAGLNVKDQSKLASQVADSLRVEMETNPLLRTTGGGLDPAILFGDVHDRAIRGTRISVISLVGLPHLEMQQVFLAKLFMTLFSWLKKNPSPPGRKLRGLLVIDEAKDFLPASGVSACADSFLRLGAQARKYHMGLVVATQHPKEIQNKLIANCSTHYYGKASSPASIKTIQEQIKLRHGGGSDVPTLPKGTFYVYNSDAGMTAPAKVRLPMCLSHHRPNPLEEEEILRRAAACRPLL